MKKLKEGFYTAKLETIENHMKQLKPKIEELGWNWVSPIINIDGIELEHPTCGDMYFTKGDYAVTFKNGNIKISKGFVYIFEGNCSSIEQLIDIQNNLNIK